MEKAEKQTIKAKGTSGFSARSSDNAVIFSIRTDKGRDEHFAFAVDDIPQIIAKMIAAHSEAARTNGRLPHAIIAQASVVATDAQTNMVTLSLMPTEHLHVPFSLTPNLATKTAESLAKAVASLRPSTGRSH